MNGNGEESLFIDVFVCEDHIIVLGTFGPAKNEKFKLILNIQFHFKIKTHPISSESSCSDSKVPAIGRSVHPPFPSTVYALLYCLSLMLKCIGMRERTVKNGHKTIKTRFGRKVADVIWLIYSVCILTEKVAYFCSDFIGTVNKIKMSSI